MDGIGRKREGPFITIKIFSYLEIVTISASNILIFLGFTKISE